MLTTQINQYLGLQRLTENIILGAKYRVQQTLLLKWSLLDYDHGDALAIGLFSFPVENFMTSRRAKCCDTTVMVAPSGE